MRSRPRVLVAIAMLGLLTLSACSSGSTDAAPAAPQAVQLTLTELQFTPPAIKVRKGKPVELQLKNAGTAEHDFVLQGMPATDIQNAEFGHNHGGAGVIAGHVVPGSTITVKFTPSQSGEWRFFCSVPGHRQAGMQGVITVS